MAQSPIRHLLDRNRAWAAEIIAQCAPLAAALDASSGGTDYRAALQQAQALLAHPEDTPSARVLERMQAEHGQSFSSFTTQQSQQARDHLLALPWQAAQQARYEALARQSIEAQKAIEAADSLPFEEWRQRYVSPEGLLV